jgi:hypothetical protein
MVQKGLDVEWCNFLPQLASRSTFLGLSNDLVFIDLFRLVRGLGTETVAQVASGDRHSLALTKAGQLYTWGDNSFGQLGLAKIPNDKTSTPKVSVSLNSKHPNKNTYSIIRIQLTTEYRTNPVFAWSILPCTGHLISGPFENQTFLSGFLA